MSSYFVCEKDCVVNNQRWYPGDKMPVTYAKDGKCPRYFQDPEHYEAQQIEKKEAKHREEVKNRLDALRTDDPTIQKMSQAVLNKTLGKKGVKLPDKPLGENWKEGQTGGEVPPIAGPQPGSLAGSKITEPVKRGPGRPPKNEAD